MKIRYHLIGDDQLSEFGDVMADVVRLDDDSGLLEHLKDKDNMHALAAIVFELAAYRKLYGPIGIKAV